MGSWHTAVLPCHCDNPLVVGYRFYKKKVYIYSHLLFKRVVTALDNDTAKGLTNVN
jgi:hypothetical protein